ncbi:MAG: translocation/assembly module TamB domain-containing protein [Proteobacteria bacterium]|nr:translocation/assembly module TamB domain-containing protein [Pseudomonadota bacterium]MBU1649049.1 translocation/assembly module TamB domain-containing protein [Pseudomonadota bacterium]
MKRWRVVSLLFLPALIVLAALAFLGLTENGLRQLAKNAVKFSDGVLAIEYVQGRLFDTWQLNGLRVKTAAVDLHCQKIEVQWQPLAIFHGTVRIVTFHGKGVDVQIKEEGQGQSNPSFVLPDILLPLGVALTTFELEDVFIHGISGMELPRVERVSLELAADKAHVTLKKFEISIPGGSVHAQGDVVLGGNWPLDLQGGGSMEEKNSKPFAADFVIRGDLMDQLTAEIDIQTPVQNRVNLTCSDLFGEVRWQLDTTLSQVKLMDLNPDWPELALASVDVKAEGTADRYQGTVQLEAAWAQFPQAEVHTEFSGNFSELQVSSLVARLPEGQLAAKGTVGWQDGVRWQVELEGKDIDPEPYFPDWKGRINSRIKTTGRLQGDEFNSETQLLALDGDLLGYPLAGSGSVTVDGDVIQVQELLLRSGESVLGVTGTVGAVPGQHSVGGAINPLDLRVHFDSENLGNLLPEAGGKAHFQGTVQGSRDVPEFSFEVDADHISYQDNVLQTLTGTGQGTFSPQGEVDVKLAGKGLHSEMDLDSLSVELSGTMARHQLQAKMSGPAGDMDILMAGGLAAQSWQGEIRDLLLRLDPYGDWKLRNPSPLRINGELVDLAPVCLEQGETSICLQGGWQSSQQWQLNADLESFAGELLYQWNLVSLPVKGTLAASVRTKGTGARMTAGAARFSVPELQISVPDEDGREQLLRWTDTFLDLKLVDSTLMSIAKTRFQDGSTIDATVNIGQFGDFSSAWKELPIQGEIALDAKDLSPIAALSNYTVKPTGSMKGTFAVEGRVGNPRLKGELRQTKGKVFIPVTGITLEDLLLSVMVKGEGMHLVLDSVSGPGKIKIVGDITRDEQAGWQVDAIAMGKDFEVAHLTDYEIVIDPDLQFVLREGVMRVNGKALVPHAVININKFDGSVTASRDVILMDGSEADKKMDPPLVVSVIIELGQDVNIDTFGLKGRLQGGVTVSDAPGLPLTGKGSLTLHEGTFVLKNHPLDISRGRFFFTGGPLDNPGIDVLAQKKTKKKTVGVIVSGTVNDMELKLFSDPPMAESQILTELLAGRSVSGTGSPMGSIVGAVATGIGFEEGGSFVSNITSRLQNQFGLDDIYVEGGESSSDVSVMIGKEVFEDLYISYGYDPFNAASLFRARYDLWKGFSVETEVGAEKTGADLLWSIEK